MPSRIELSQQLPFKRGKLSVTPALRRIVHDDGRELTVEPRVMQVFNALHLADGAILSRKDLIDLCWDGRTVSKDAVNRVISLLHTLAAGIGDGSFRVDTVSRVGYRLIDTSSQDGKPSRATPALPHLDRRFLIAGAALAVAIPGAWLLRSFHGPASDAQPTIAVMPFKTPAGSPDYLGTAAAREIRQSLSRIDGLRVISDASSFSLAGAQLSPRELGKRLGAGLLVLGSIGALDKGVQGRVELVDAATQIQRLAYAETLPYNDISTLTEALGGHVVEYILTKVVPPASRSALPPQKRIDPRAFPHMAAAEQAFLQTRSLMADNNEAVAKARANVAYDQARAALAIDADDVRSLLVLWGLARNGWSERLQAERPPGADRTTFALGFVQRALAADPNDPAALAALGDAYRRYQWRWREAESLLSRAVRADPGLVEARWAYGTLLGTLNRSPEGVRHAREMVLLDPENATRRGYLLPRLNFAAGNRVQALRQYDDLLPATPDSTFIMWEIYMSHLTSGDAAGLDALVRRIRQLPPPRFPSAREKIARTVERIEAAAAALRGNPQRLRQIVRDEVAGMDGDQQTAEGRVDGDRLFLDSLEYAWAGETEGAIDLLGRALAASSLNWIASLPYGVTPYPQAVAGHARFMALWNGDSRLAELMNIRRDNLTGGKARGSG